MFCFVVVTVQQNVTHLCYSVLVTYLAYLLSFTGQMSADSWKYVLWIFVE